MSIKKFIQSNSQAFDSETPRPQIWEAIRQELEAEPTDTLADFVANNRSAFDDQTPPAELFDRIQNHKTSPLSVSKKPSAYHRTWWLQAAVVLLLIGAGLAGGRILGYQAAQDEYLALARKIQPDFPEAEAYYQQNIAAMSTQVYQNNPDTRLIADLNDMDRAIKELRQELPQVPPQQQARVVADLIKTYQIKLNILQKILASLPETNDNNRKTQQYENDEI